jgi:pimeloyl-ACP methyl ester carboxylesterase
MIVKKLRISLKGIPLEIAYFFRLGNETTLLYLHGGGCSKNDFAESLKRKELAQFTLVGFDFPGCGDSPYPATTSLNIDDLVEITQLVTNKLGLKNIVLVGHSMGGLVALLLAEKYPDHIKAFISVEGNLSPDSCNFSRKIIGFGLEEWKEKEFPRLITELLESGNIGREAYAATLNNHASPRAFYDVCHQIVDYSVNGNLTEKFIGLAIPKILLYGSENKSMRHIETLKREDVLVQEIPSSNHFLFYDNPERYYEEVSRFLQEII